MYSCPLEFRLYNINYSDDSVSFHWELKIRYETRRKRRSSRDIRVQTSLSAK